MGSLELSARMASSAAVAALSKGGGIDCSPSTDIFLEFRQGRDLSRYSGHGNIVYAPRPFRPAGQTWRQPEAAATRRSASGTRALGKPRPRPDGKPLRLGGQGRQVFAVGFAADGAEHRLGTRIGQVLGLVNKRRPYLNIALPLPLARASLARRCACRGRVRRLPPRTGTASAAYRLAIERAPHYGGYPILDFSNDGSPAGCIHRPATRDERPAASLLQLQPDGETVVSGGYGWRALGLRPRWQQARQIRGP